MSQKKPKKTIKYLIGIDEVGRGPIAGPVTVGAVLIEKQASIKILARLKKLGLKDSKQLSENSREILYKEILILKKSGQIDFNTSSMSALEIDKIGISKCIKKNISNSLKKFGRKCHECEIKLDGSLKAPEEYVYQETIIKGDDLVAVISAASIVAKVTRDRKMVQFSKKFPEYNFHIHKGYGTSNHIKNIKKFGLSDIHRVSFCGNHLSGKSILAKNLK